MTIIIHHEIINQNNYIKIERKRGEYLENSGGRSDVWERGLDGAGWISGESGLDEFPLQFEGGGGWSLDIAVWDLLGAPLVTGAPANECENSHFGFP